MRKTIKLIVTVIMILTLTLNYTIVFAEPTEDSNLEVLKQDGGTPPEKPEGEAPVVNGENPPVKPEGEAGAPGENAEKTITHTGAVEISADTINDYTLYSSTTGSQNALLVKGGISSISNPTITKSGDSEGDESDFYGINAAVLALDGTLNINSGTINTNGVHANGVFAYSKGTVNVTDTVIKTSNNNSGAIMVTGGGKLTANNVTAETDGNSSAPIRSDRGGGTLIVNGGKFTSHGTGSPVIYSTANITVNNASLISTASEGVVVEGKNSVILNNVNMQATNNTLNSNSETYKSIFIYQSMSGDADVGTSSFTANNSKIINNKGEVIFVTNTNTIIELENNEITNNDSSGDFIKVAAAKWGKAGENGGTATLNAKNQKIVGNISVDKISTLDLSLANGSSYSGTINDSKTAKKISITLDASSTLSLTGDSYITTLNNAVIDNSNINLNGFKLYVNGTAITVAEYKGAADAENKALETSTTQNTIPNSSPLESDIMLPIATIIVAIFIILVLKKSTKK